MELTACRRVSVRKTRQETGAIIFQIWRVKIKLSDYEESEMKQF